MVFDALLGVDSLVSLWLFIFVTVGENNDYNDCHEDDDTDGGSIVMLVDYFLLFYIPPTKRCDTIILKDMVWYCANAIFNFLLILFS